MNAEELLFECNIMELDGVQSPDVLQYGISRHPDQVLEWGVWVCSQSKRNTVRAVVPQVSAGKAAACALTKFLFEHRVEPCHLEGVVEDLRRDGAVHRLEAMLHHGEEGPK